MAATSSSSPSSPPKLSEDQLRMDSLNTLRLKAREYELQLQKKVEEDYESSYGKTDKRDWYEKDDNSYLKDVPRGVKPKTKDSQ